MEIQKNEFEHNLYDRFMELNKIHEFRPISIEKIGKIEREESLFDKKEHF